MIILIHGKGGSPTSSWLPWMRRELAHRAVDSLAPTFPPQDDSRLADWFTVLNALSLDLASTTFIAHARGAMALLRWINTLPKSAQIRQIITVSCNFDYQPQRTDGDEFYLKPLDYDDIRAKCRNITVIHSADDPYVPIKAGEELAAHLHAKFVAYKTAGHFGSEKTEAPELLKELE